MASTPAERWKLLITKYRKKCQEILELSKSVRYVGVINAYGRTLTGLVQPNVKPLLKSEQVKNEFFIISTLMTLRKDSEKTIGRLDYAMLRHSKVDIFLFQKGNVTYYVSVSKKAKNVESIMSSIKKII